MAISTNMKRVTSTDWKILDLLVSGADNSEIARELNMNPRTVKAHFQKLFSLFGIADGIKRVKLAVLIYRSQSCQNFMEVMCPRSSFQSECKFSIDVQRG
jgi:DNA-binding NarL/FixJ family response regulator